MGICMGHTNSKKCFPKSQLLQKCPMLPNSVFMWTRRHHVSDSVVECNGACYMHTRGTRVEKKGEHTTKEHSTPRLLLPRQYRTIHQRSPNTGAKRKQPPSRALSTPATLISTMAPSRTSQMFGGNNLPNVTPRIFAATFVNPQQLGHSRPNMPEQRQRGEIGR